MRCTRGVPTLHVYVYVSQVTRVSEQEALQCEAYILLYERQREPGREGGTAEGQGDGRGDGRNKGRSKGQAGGRGERAESSQTC